ncbi:hypothetical protein LWI29_010547 [Acer saccharum]|uniref:Transposase MuDR plant domain-containing protein n=1 Tax=Acer saccharum TaxID=4024 RepID=A0AA39VYK9_ACESA|nr:hypothetical protein LWI29_010547 [Acer saccharum]
MYIKRVNNDSPNLRAIAFVSPKSHPREQRFLKNLFFIFQANRYTAIVRTTVGAKADAKDNGHDVVGDGSDFVGYQPTWVNEECYEELLGEDVERANCQRKKKGKQIAEEVESVEEIVESDYDQELEDITSDTCVDPNKDWDSLEFPDVPRAECGSRFDIDDGSDDLNSLDGSDCEDDEGRHPRKFLNTRYHQFNPDCDMQHPIFRVGMVFGSADVFRQAIRAHAITNRREVKFQKNDANRVRAVCKAEGCNWFVFAS